MPTSIPWRGQRRSYLRTQFLAEGLKVQDALLLDNGGDVRLWYRGRDLVESGQGRQEVQALLVRSVATDGGGSSISVA